MERGDPGVADRLSAIETRLAAVLREQRNIHAALQLMLEGQSQQTALLSALATLAEEEPQTSELSSSLNRLTRAVLALEMVSAKLNELPEKIGTELEKRFSTAGG